MSKLYIPQFVKGNRALVSAPFVSVQQADYAAYVDSEVASLPRSLFSCDLCPFGLNKTLRCFVCARTTGYRFLGSAE